MNKAYALGIDAGGTNTKFVLIECCDRFLPITYSCPTESVRRSSEDFSNALSDAALEFISKNNVTPNQVINIGISVPGRVDYKRGIVKYAYNLGLCDISLSDGFLRAFPSAHIAVMNDADAAAYAEYCHGSIAFAENACLLTLGTGLGAGFIINGKLFLGGRSRGVEFGHAVIDKSGSFKCTCGETGCAEALCGSIFFKKRTCELFGRELDAEEVFMLRAQNDENAIKIVNEYIENLTSAIVTVVNTMDPEKIAIGGGIAQALDVFLAEIQEKVDKHCFFEYAGLITQAKLGTFAGSIGAALWSYNSQHA